MTGPRQQRTGKGGADLRKLPKKLSQKKAEKKEQVPISPHPSDIGLSYPKADTAFKALLTARFCAAIWSNISDCDETYNFWEPSHYMLYGKGFQTWEYSPEYALRSYTYIMVNMLPAWLYAQIAPSNRFFIFYLCRCLFAFVCARCELYFYKAVCREFGVAIARLTILFLLFSAGMFISCTAYLPSTFSMYMTLVSMAAWFQRKYELAILTTALSAILSWPFAGIIGLPIALDLVLRRKELSRFVGWCVISVIIIVPTMIWLDSMYYGRLVFAPFNIILYNVFTSHGPDLYGTEPWSFYFVNLFLNFNFVALFAVLTPFALILAERVLKSQPHNACLPFWLSLMPLYLWCFIFFFQPHKEERFLFPVYPLICLCGAVTVDSIQKLVFAALLPYRKRIWRAQNDGKPIHYLHDTNAIFVGVVAVCAILGLSRIYSLYNGYHAPLEITMEVGSLESTYYPKHGKINVCFGKEWYRFPTSFFLPNDKRVLHEAFQNIFYYSLVCSRCEYLLCLGPFYSFQVKFIKSEFKGQLPATYSSALNATAIIPKNMNSMNKEEPSRYFPVGKCHFLIDSYLGYETPVEPHFATDTSSWEILKSLPFLNAAKSDRFFRAFYIPYFTERFCNFGTYYLLRSLRN